MSRGGSTATGPGRLGDDVRGLDLATEEMSRLDRYRYLTQVVVPRPIAWIVSTSRSGPATASANDCNLAPYAYFNIVSSHPAAVVIGVNSEANERLCKDTLGNLRAQGSFTVSIPHVDLADQVTATAAPLPPGTSEAEACGVELEAWPSWHVPRVARAKVSLACRLITEVELGDQDSQTIVVASIERLWLDRRILTLKEDGSVRVDLQSFDPLGRVGRGMFTALEPPFRTREELLVRDCAGQGNPK